MNLIQYLSKLKNTNPWLKVLWFKSLKSREKKTLKQDLRSRIENIFNQGHDYPLNLEHPETFYDKLNWLKLNYRNPLMPIVADKYEVRKYLEDLGYGYLLNDLLGVWDNVKDFSPSTLPEKFALKSTHGSGPNWIKIVNDKSKVNWFAQKKIMNQWLKNNIAWMGGEWHYGEMKPRIIAEKFLDGGEEGLIDYKIHCFNGKPLFILACLGRSKGKVKFYCFDTEWNLLRINKASIAAPKGFTIPKPENLNKMLEIAQDLSQPFPVVRMDFYSLNGRLYFGEFTFFESGGFDDDYTYEGQKFIGGKIKLPEANI